MMIKFEWDTNKALANQKKHGVSFEEVKSVFMMTLPCNNDDEHSGEEHRFLMLGFSCESRMLLVCHCERESGNTIKIISSRKATKSECSHYKGNVS